LSSIPIILFLNKKDLFEHKIKRKNINIAFPEYKGDNSFDDTIEFITEQFLDKNHNSDRSMFKFVTFVADTDQIRKIISAVTDIVIEQKVRKKNSFLVVIKLIMEVILILLSLFG